LYRTCPLSGVKRTWAGAVQMSAFDPKRTSLPWRESADLPRIEHRREPPEGDMQRRGVSGQPSKGRRQRTKPKARKVPTARVSAANLQEKLDQRTRERDEALEQQTATSEVLTIIRRSPADAQPVFDAIVQSATRLCDAIFSVVYLYDGALIRLAATQNFTPEATSQINKLQQLKPPTRSHLAGRAILDRAIVHVHDVLADPEYSRELALAGGWRAVLAVPLLRDAKPVGALSVAKAEPTPFSDRQIQLLNTFADQAVIAIENVRLFEAEQQRTRELSEALEQQTATSEVLKVISSSPGELEPVFNAMLENAVRICEAKFGIMFSFNDGAFHALSSYGDPGGHSIGQPHVLSENPHNPLTRMAAAKETVHIADLTAERAYTERNPRVVRLVESAGARTLLDVPMLKDGGLIGAFVLYRQEVRPFADKQIELVKNFAAQAVIAIENTRLLNELRESLQQQTATADVLRVVSNSAGQLQPVFNAMLENATRICEAAFGSMLLMEGDVFRRVAIHNAPPTFAEFHERVPVVKPQQIHDLKLLLETKRPVHIADAAAADTDSPIVKYAGARTLLIVPMLKEGELIGAIGIYRQEVRPFTDKQIELVANFAAQAVIAIENTRLLNELRESLQQQTATADVLKVISSSPGTLDPVFSTMLAKATELCEASYGTLWLQEGDGYRTAAIYGDLPPAWIEQWRSGVLYRPRRDVPLARAAEERQPIQVADMRADPSYLHGDPLPVSGVEIAGIRTLLVVPMFRESEFVGAIAIYRKEVLPFTEKQIELVKNFAAQAVIAIENTRLLNELRESLQQQTATADVLKVISSSPGKLEPVFQAMLENAVHICGAKFGQLWLREGDTVRSGASYGAPEAFAAYLGEKPVFRPRPETGLGQVLRTKQPFQLADLAAEPTYEDALRKAAIKLAGTRSMIGVPMVKDDAVIGVIVIYRQEVRPFTDKQIELVSNFAAQAVIAIENTRLLNELRESLQQQTATADVLKVISRSTFDLKTVLDALVESAARLCEAYDAIIMLREGKSLRIKAHYGPIPMDITDWPIERDSVSGRAFVDRTPTHVLDLQVATDEFPFASKVALRLGYRTGLAVPLLRQGDAIGVLAIRRTEVKAFTDKQIGLAATFADQAVIAIENVRLFDEVQARTRELSESLEQQTATSEVLKVISSSPGELEPVFTSVLENAVRLCEANFGNLFLYDGEAFRTTALHHASSVYEESRRLDIVVRDLHPDVPLARISQAKETVHIADVRMAPAYLEHDPRFTELVEGAGARTLLVVPMLKENELVGAIAIYRQEVNPFADKQIALVQNFAAQAVIAIENTRLLNELRESLQQQTATSDVLKIISRSTFDLRTVLQTLIESAARFCDADKAIILREKEGAFYRTEAYGFSREFLDYVKDIPIEADRGSASGRALLESRVIHIADVTADPEYTLAEVQRLGDYRTILSVPMLREGVPIGVLVLMRSEVRPFSEKQIELVTTFADQAAIAIENVRLFDSVEARTRQLAASLENLRTTQDRLVQTQKLASLGQLTAGIAHEIKNPLNFVNNFSGVSVELIDELRQALAGANLDGKLRAEISEIADTLQGNLDKVVQHGKRADAIVKNMLLHSREGSGEHRLVDVNAIVEESLNLAYHGARAEKQGFNITMERSLDPAAGEADVFPQDITRALLNLISNGFYAATKRSAEANGGDYEPTLVAVTRNLGDRVEIRIRDNGTGIPLEVKEKIFNPFFTTKPAGEGTGLGLSISHDIIVKQHGGSIEVDTQPGEFTEITIILPRAAVFLAERT
jgi:two-component system, NtrC family, sensor kinase